MLVGRETNSRMWSGFGGKAEPGDATPLDTALREMDEETCGLFDPQVLSQIRTHPERFMIEHIQTTTPRGFVFHMFVIDFTPFIYMLETTEARFDALRERETDTHRQEKDRVQWVNVLTKPFDRFYRPPFMKDLRLRLIPVISRWASSPSNSCPHTIAPPSPTDSQSARGSRIVSSYP